VKPDTVVKWHRWGFRYYWRRKSKPHKIGRPPIGRKLVHLIKRMSRENPLRGSPRIHEEPALLGQEVAESTIDKYRVRHRDPERGQLWRTFLQNHMDSTIACDFFTVPTVTFRNLFVFVVLHHGSRQILHVNVTAHPTAEWTAQRSNSSRLSVRVTRPTPRT
jgi:putative transposase